MELYLHSPEDEVKKKETSHKQKTARHYVLLIVSGVGGGAMAGGVAEGGAALAVHVLVAEVWKVATAPTSGSVWHRQTSCPPALGLKATSTTLCARVEDVSTEARPRRSSRSPRKRWPSCHQSPSRCTCRRWRCRSSGPTRIPWTGRDEEKKRRLESSFGNKTGQLALLGGRSSQRQPWRSLICVPGICWRRRESSKRSGDCPSQCLRTIYLQTRSD